MQNKPGVFNKISSGDFYKKNRIKEKEEKYLQTFEPRHQKR